MHRFNRISRRVISANIFDDENQDGFIKRSQVLSTRIYIPLLIIILLGFSLYTLLTNERKTIKISAPTQEQYEELQNLRSSKLECPCENISISYKKLMNITPSYHPICSSDFITPSWIDFLYSENMSYYFQLDFRHSAAFSFQILRTLCEQTQAIIEDNLIEFYSNQYLTLQLVSNKTFTVETNAFIDLFKRTIPSLFQNQITLFRYMMINNRLFSAVETKSTLQLEGIPNRDSFLLHIHPIYYHEVATKGKKFDCYQSTSKINRLPSGIYVNLTRYDYPGSSPILSSRNASTLMINATIILPGLFVGCLPTESLMQSNLRCFFNETCLSILISYLNESTSSFKVLNASRFPPSTSIETLAYELFIESWSITKSYEEYFQQCHPTYCQYTIEAMRNVVNAFTSIISLYGGLTLVLRLLVPNIVMFIRNKIQQRRPNLTEAADLVPVRTSLYLFLRKVRTLIIDLNLFNSYSQIGRIQRKEQIVTRVYLIVLVLSLIMSGVYVSTKSQNKTVVVANPTIAQFEQLNNLSLNDFRCPCTQISFRYESFITIHPKFHPICSSVFVSDLWYDNNYWIDQEKNLAIDDFRFIAYEYFSLLSAFCELVHDTIQTSLLRFNATEYITIELISMQILQNEFLSFLHLFESTIKQTFKQAIDILRSTTFSNRLISSLKLAQTTYFDSKNKHNAIQWYFLDYVNCSCGVDFNCKAQIRFRASLFTHDYVRGMYVSCYIVDSLLLTTTECFFDEQCLMRIKSYMNAQSMLYKILHPMNISQITRFQTNTSIETLVKNLFIDDWNANYSYEKYYSQCKVSYCSYTIVHQVEFIYISSQIIAIFGGLLVVLKICARIIIQISTRERRRARLLLPLNVCEKSRQFGQWIKSTFLYLNLFQTKSRNVRVVRRQRLTTKFYLVILWLSLVILFFYTSFTHVSTSSSVRLPSRNHYENLDKIYSTALNCPCSRISIDYDEFIQIHPSYHQICYSNFTNRQWFNGLFNKSRQIRNNFHSIGSIYFPAILFLCELVQTTVNTSLAQLYARKFLSIQLISSKLFQIQIDSSVQPFIRSTPKIFERTFDLVRELIQGNALMSSHESNWKFTLLDLYDRGPVYTNPQSYQNSCSCATSNKCSRPVGLPGLYIGCYPFESLLQSSLECFYNETCLQTFMLSMNFSGSNEDFSTLNSSLLNSYEINETIQSMINRLFVNQWYINKSYDKYFDICQPVACTYSYVKGFNLFDVVTYLFALYCGLSKTLKIILPFLFHLIFFVLNQGSTHVATANENQ
ncbi:unnamed protein product [Adineta ricciae]|uniref:Uncharacterized protein n=1 Tax=Adineta ricciae TaxID=249248 RepID=A0A814VRQ7_ADIRI|nr:unnamed protein product [Adineta ricciae]